MLTQLVYLEAGLVWALLCSLLSKIVVLVRGSSYPTNPASHEETSITLDKTAHNEMLDRWWYILTIYKNMEFITGFLMLLSCSVADVLWRPPA
jgi:hypothetical protein